MGFVLELEGKELAFESGQTHTMLFSPLKLPKKAQPARKPRSDSKSKLLWAPVVNPQPNPTYAIRDNEPPARQELR